MGKLSEVNCSDTPCPTFRLAKRSLEPPRQPPLVPIPVRQPAFATA